MQGPCFHLWAHSEVLGVRTATYNILGTQLNPFLLDMLLPPSNMFFFWKLSHPRRSSPSWTLSSPCALCILPLPLTCASRLCPTASRPCPPGPRPGPASFAPSTRLAQTAGVWSRSASPGFFRSPQTSGTSGPPPSYPLILLIFLLPLPLFVSRINETEITFQNFGGFGGVSSGSRRCLGEARRS